MKTIISALALAGIMAGSVPALAGPVNLKQVDQERRIDAGVRSGKLTRAEANRLKTEQRSIRQLEDRLRARNGGKLTQADKRVIHQRQQVANDHILNQKRDRQRGPNKLKIG